NEFRNPGIAELAKIGRGVTGKGCQQLLVRCAPRQLLHFDVNAGMRPLELGQELGDDFAFAAHRPESNQVRVVAARRAAADQERKCSGKRQREAAAKRHRWACATYCADAVSQPPSKPARIRPWRTYGFFRITPQIIALR